MWKRSPDRKAPARKQVAKAPAVRSVTRSRVSINPEVEEQTFVNDTPIVDQTEKMMQQAIESEQYTPQEEALPTSSSSYEEVSSDATLSTSEPQYEEEQPTEQSTEQPTEQEDYYEEESYVPPPPPKQQIRSAPASLKAAPQPKQTVAPVQQAEAPPRTTPKNNSLMKEEGLSKSAFTRLIRAAGVASANSTVIEAIKEIIPDFLQRLFDEFCANDKVITNDKVSQIISRYIRDEEKELVNEASLTSGQFQSLIFETTNKSGITIKRDALYMLHLFTESMLHKFVQGGDMIAEANRRTRVDAKDISVAYMIYTM